MAFDYAQHKQYGRKMRKQKEIEKNLEAVRRLALLYGITRERYVQIKTLEWVLNEKTKTKNT